MKSAALLTSLIVASFVAACGDNEESPTNQPPAIDDRAVTTAEDTELSITVPATDADGDPLSFTYASPQHGTISGSGATVTYTPEPNFHGTDSVAVTVGDGTTAASATITVTVTPVNDTPVAADDAVAANEDTAATIQATTLVANDSDVDADALTVSTIGTPSAGTAVLAGGAITYTPPANFVGTATFEYTVSDGSATDTATVTVTVGGDNDAPVAVDDTATTAEDQALAVQAATLTANDTDAENQALTVTAVANPTHGTVALAGGEITFTPTADFHGTATFEYTVSDGAADDVGLVTVTVTPVNDPPAATAGTASTDEEVAVTITLAGTDIDGDPLTFAISMPPGAGTLGAVTQLTPTTASVVYTPNTNATGSDGFQFTVNDGTATSAPAAVAITVGNLNDAPVATAGSATTSEDTAIDLDLAGSDVDGNALTFAIATPPSIGTLGAITQLTPTTARVRYTPNANVNGGDTFTFTVSDGSATSAPALVMLMITPVNDPPVAVDDSDVLERDTPRTQPFAFYLANDGDGGDGGALTIASVSGADHGTVAIAGGNVVFTPDSGYVGSAGFDYVVSDGTGMDTGHVALTVLAGNTAPVAVDDTDDVNEDATLSRPAAVYVVNDIDPDPQTLQITQVHDAVNGTVGFDGMTITFTPTANYAGPASFDYTVSDGLVDDVGHVAITVHPVNDAPVATNDSATTDEDTAVVVAVLTNDTNDDGALTIQSFTQGAHGTVATSGGGLQYVPAANYNGNDTFTYTVVDPGGLTATASVEVTIAALNDAPVAVDVTQSMNENGSLAITLSGTDPEVPPQMLTFSAGTPSAGSLGAVTQIDATSASVTFTPPANFVGDATFSFTVSDGITVDTGAVLVHVQNVVSCGDGVTELPETCDDGGIVSGDGCSASCAVESGWDCGATSPSVCQPICGDTIVIAGEEECDDGNGVDTDGCTTQCESGPACAATVAALAAGDRFVTDPATGRCYVSFDDEVTTYSSAQTACIAAGGHLAVITSAAEQAIVASVQNPAQDPWIGLSDQAVEGTFRWITGEPLGFTNWEPGQPDGPLGAEDCVQLLSTTAPSGTAGTWNDIECDIAPVVGRICELPDHACGDGFTQTVRGEQCDDGNTTAGDGCSATCQTEAVPVFFSEYVEGSGNSKALEIANLSTAPVALTGCSIRTYFNGATAAGSAFALTQTIAPNDVLVLCHASAATAVLNACDVAIPGTPTANAVTTFNGDDAVELVCNGTTIDVIGQIGVDPGAEWGSGNISTENNTIRRKCAVTTGDTNGTNAFDPTTQWGGFAQDTFNDLGTYTCVP